MALLYFNRHCVTRRTRVPRTMRGWSRRAPMGPSCVFTPYRYGATSGTSQRQRAPTCLVTKLAAAADSSVAGSAAHSSAGASSSGVASSSFATKSNGSNCPRSKMVGLGHFFGAGTKLSYEIRRECSRQPSQSALRNWPRLTKSPAHRLPMRQMSQAVWQLPESRGGGVHAPRSHSHIHRHTFNHEQQNHQNPPHRRRSEKSRLLVHIRN